MPRLADLSVPDLLSPTLMPHEDLSGRTIAGYRLLKRVGEGGTASVYRAEHPERGLCAVKILRERMRKDPTAVKRFLREAGYGSRVQHPAVVRTYDYGEEDGLDYLALEWAAGEPLSEFVHRSGPLAPELVVHVISQLAGGLSAAHAVGIIHRDLKPENISYDPATRQVKLLDFGIARDAQADVADRLTRTGFFVGTLPVVAFFVRLGITASEEERPGLLALLPIFAAGATFFTTSSMVARPSTVAVMSSSASSSVPALQYARAHSTGSPASRMSTKWTPLTTRPFCMSRHGMIRIGWSMAFLLDRLTGSKKRDQVCP